MKLTVLYAVLMVMFTAYIAKAQDCGGDWDCSFTNCQPCHFASHTCYLEPCAPCGVLCGTIAALPPEAKRALRAKQVMDAVTNPARLTDAGMLWQAASQRRTLIPNLSHTPGANLPVGHPTVNRMIAAKQKCSISQEAQLVRLDFMKYR